MKVGDRVAGLLPGTVLAPGIVIEIEGDKYTVQCNDLSTHVFAGPSGLSYLTREQDLQPDTQVWFGDAWRFIESVIAGDLVPIKQFGWTADYSYHRTMICRTHRNAVYITKNPFDRSILTLKHDPNCLCHPNDLLVVVSKSQPPR